LSVVKCCVERDLSLVQRMLSSVACLSVIAEPHTGGTGPLGLLSDENKVLCFMIITAYGL
jgi:hypothetical protein